MKTDNTGRIALVHRGRQRHRPRGGTRPAGRRLPRCAGRPPRRAPADPGGRGCVTRPDSTGRTDQCVRPGQRTGTVRHHRAQLRPPRPAVQQRRRQRPGCAAGRAAAGELVQRDQHQRHRRLPVRPRRLRADAPPGASGRTHHQQRLDLGAHAAALHRALHRQQACGDRPDQGAGARRAGLQHRGQPDRHRQCADRAVRAHDTRGAAGQRQRGDGTHDGRPPCGRRPCATSPRCRCTPTC